MKTDCGFKILKSLLIFSLLFFILPLNSQKNTQTKGTEIDKVIKELKSEKEYYLRLLKVLKNKEEALKQWESELEIKSKELEKERKRLNQEWKNLAEARKAKKVDQRIKKILETVDPQSAVESIVHYYNTDKKMFYSIGLSILTMKKGVRISILQGLANSHKEIFIDLIDFLARQAGYEEKMNELKKIGGGKNG